MAQADYGIDAPPVIRNLGLGGSAIILIGLAAVHWMSEPAWLKYLLGYWGLFAGGSMLITALLMIWSSKVGKLHKRKILINSLKLKGNETVLDLGCGRGLLLIEAAKHLSTGKAIGIDLWQSMDLSGNKLEVTLANARLEKVSERVEIKTGDIRKLPFADGSLDVVVASLSIHNIPDKQGREKAIQEIHRVLKPGGQTALLDFQRTDEYYRIFQFLGWKDIQHSGASFWMFPPVRTVSGKKPV